ncbi:MAG: hypothetical protein WA610_08265 [Thermodesulfovibrionales bacterium]
MNLSQTKNRWTRFWMHFAGLSGPGRFSTRLATWFAPPYYGRCHLARLNPKGYIAPTAAVYHGNLRLGEHVFVGDRVVIFQDKEGGAVEIGEGVHLYGESFIQTGSGGTVRIGRDTHIQPRCQLSAYKAAINIGKRVQIAPNCAFYPYDHGTAADISMMNQPLTTKGDIVVEDEVWLGFGVIVLDGVRIGKGAVIGAGSVVTRDIPEGAVAVGNPARVIRMRDSLMLKKELE